MNLIPCNKPCKHQQDGYCSVSGISEPIDALPGECSYFVSSDTAKPSSVDNYLPSP